MMEIWSTHPDGKLAAVVDDNEIVAYLYIVREDTIVGDVWLYNHGNAPTEPEWHDPDRAPFRNAAGFAIEADVQPIGAESDVRFEWRDTADGARVDLYVRGQHVAIGGEGLRPGYCMFAAKDGPLALRMRGDA